MNSVMSVFIRSSVFVPATFMLANVEHQLLASPQLLAEDGVYVDRTGSDSRQ